MQRREGQYNVGNALDRGRVNVIDVISTLEQHGRVDGTSKAVNKCITIGSEKVLTRVFD